MQSDIVQRLQEIRAFLDGSGELNGLSFGDRTVHPATGKPVLFWWRRELTALDEAAAEITRLTEALRAAEEREKALRHHWAALDKALTDNIIETDQPHRVRWEGEWHYGPLADAYFAMTSVVRKLARQALAGAKP